MINIVCWRIVAWIFCHDYYSLLEYSHHLGVIKSSGFPFEHLFEAFIRQ